MCGEGLIARAIIGRQSLTKFWNFVMGVGFPKKPNLWRSRRSKKLQAVESSFLVVFCTSFARSLVQWGPVVNGFVSLVDDTAAHSGTKFFF